jgi:hypothetical protein
MVAGRPEDRRFDEVAPVPADAGLRRRYARYRRREARRLLDLLPARAARELWRTAVAEVAERDPRSAVLSTQRLAEYCERLLPLPPFETWLEDFRAHRAEHLADDLDDPAAIADGAPPAEPFGVETRRFRDEAGEEWAAVLAIRAEAVDRWCGHVVFHPVRPDAVSAPAGRTAFRTGEILREASAEAVRERFGEFAPVTLRAFLRSARP